VQLLDEFASRRAAAEVRENLAGTGSWPLLDPCLKFERGEWSGEEAAAAVMEGEVAAVAVDGGEEAVKEVVGVEEKTGVEEVENVGEELRAEAVGKVDGEVRKGVDEEEDVDASVPVKTVISKENELCKWGFI